MIKFLVNHDFGDYNSISEIYVFFPKEAYQMICEKSIVIQEIKLIN